MTFLHHKNFLSKDEGTQLFASSLQHTNGFSIGSAEHRSHKPSKDVFDGDQHFLTLKLNLPPPLLLVIMHSLVFLL